jgi:hypothetical protein
VATLTTCSRASDDTTNIHPDRGANNCDGPRGWTYPEDRVLVECVFVEIVTESETCHIYKVVLLTIKLAARNVSGDREKHTKTRKHKSNTAKLDVGLLLLERTWTSLNLVVFILEIDLTSSCFSRF